jgi:hypothetical protein
MSVVDQAVQDGIGKRCIADCGVPVFNGKQAGHDGRAVAVAVVKHFQQVAPVCVIEHGQSPVVNHEHVYLGKLPEAVQAGQKDDVALMVERCHLAPVTHDARRTHTLFAVEPAIPGAMPTTRSGKCASFIT